MSQPVKTILRSNDFSCPSCVTKLERALGAVPGVNSAKVHFTTGRIEVEHDANEASIATLVETVERAGYRSRPSPF